MCDVCERLFAVVALTVPFCRFRLHSARASSAWIPTATMLRFCVDCLLHPAHSTEPRGISLLHSALLWSSVPSCRPSMKAPQLVRNRTPPAPSVHVAQRHSAAPS